MKEELVRQLVEFIKANYFEGTILHQGPIHTTELKEEIEKRPTFAEYLFPLIDAKGLTDVECYKRARIDRRTFSKIKSDREYHPSRETVCAFAIALELDIRETQKLLDVEGFSLSRTRMYDTIIAFFIKNGIYDIDQINEALAEYKQPIFE